MQVIGVGSQHDFEAVQDFVYDTDMQTVEILWDPSGNLWSLNGVRNISQMQLFSFDLARESDVVFFDASGRAIFLDAAIQMPWSPVDRPTTP